MKKRFMLATAMISDPMNYLMDEVINGLDPEGIAFFKDFTRQMKIKERAVLFSSHILSLVEDLADRVVFIHKGKVVAVKSMEEVRLEAGKMSSSALVTLDRIDQGILSVIREKGFEVNLEGNIIRVQGKEVNEVINLA